MTENPFLEPVATAAAHTDMNLADSGDPAPHHQPPGTEPSPDLSKLSPLELDNHHARQLYGIVKWHGLNGVAPYVDKHPEAARVVTKSNPSTFVPKPPGYIDAVALIAGGWLTSDPALLQTNRQDVTTLNASVGGSRFNPDNHFSRPIGNLLRKRLAELFAVRGYILPESVNTLSKVKQAAKSAKAGMLPGADAFGSIGTKSNGVLTIGGETFRTERHNGHDCIRLMVNGTRLRLRLDMLTEFLRLTGLLHGQAGSTPSFTNVVRGRTGPDDENGRAQTVPPIILPEIWPQSGNATADPTREPAPYDGYWAPGTDPLELTDTEIAEMRTLHGTA